MAESEQFTIHLLHKMLLLLVGIVMIEVHGASMSIWMEAAEFII